jgi:hypothetical protein
MRTAAPPEAGAQPDSLSDRTTFNNRRPDMNLQQMANQIAEQHVKEILEADEAKRRALLPTPQQQVEAEHNAMEFRARIADHALAAGVRPSAVRHVVRDAASIFELRDGMLRPRDAAATDPTDPLTPLTPRLWLEQLATSDGYLFVEPRRTH